MKTTGQVIPLTHDVICLSIHGSARGDRSHQSLIIERGNRCKWQKNARFTQFSVP